MNALARVSDDLLLAAQSGDRHALTQLLVALQPDIRRYARRHCHRTSVIEDVVQEALIVVYRRVGTIRSPAALAGWLALVMFSLAVAWVLDDEFDLDRGLSFAIVAAVWMIAAIVLQRVARARLARVRGLPQTKATIKEDVEWAKAQTS